MVCGMMFEINHNGHIEWIHIYFIGLPVGWSGERVFWAPVGWGGERVAPTQDKFIAEWPLKKLREYLCLAFLQFIEYVCHG
jgi:hypothetical protein